MQDNLVIVESPAKAKTIEKFLGKDFHVTSSMGHIRDLEKKDAGIDLENNYVPKYVVSPDKKKIVTELKKLAKDAKQVWIASDEDREGEAIAWHLQEVLKLKPEKTKRIVFHEITKDAILKAVKNPRPIDINLVNAQQARRVLDRLVGFEVSPVLWKKVKPSLSAGRVQSVAVRLIVEREREIINFESTSAFRVTAVFLVPDDKGNTVELKAELNKRFETKAEAQKFLEKCQTAEFSIADIQTRPSKRTPAAPFTTSTLQQEASRKLGFSVSQTMSVAQRLYESGKITYMRTDSVNLSDLAINTSKSTIINTHGEKYHKYRQYTTKSKGAQEAHEAIRPTYMDQEEVSGTAQEKRLYELIWKRTIASQMADAELERTTVSIKVSNTSEVFQATGEVIKFDGFLRVYLESTDNEDEGSDAKSLLPPVKTNQVLRANFIEATERFSQKPPRYTEASLVKKLEEQGIGRPSTYAPTITTIQNRGYVVKEDRPGVEREYIQLTLKNGKLSDKTKVETTGAEKSKLFPTDIGMVVNDFLMKYFDQIMDYSFTANVEVEFDEIADGKRVWNEVIDEFYKPFHQHIENALEVSERTNGERVLGDDPKTGLPVSVKIGRYGPLAQLGEATEEGEKPQFASLRPGQILETITLEEALELFKLPREIGEYEGKKVKVNIGRFGPYIQHDSKFVSLEKNVDDPYSVELPRAIELIEAKREKDRNALIKTFEEEPELRILNGRWGPYISYKKKNYKIAKGTEAEKLSLEDCMKIIEAGPAPKKGRKK
ncbi:type I DNA topoisomerase [Mangrovibacterium diazotrophicum]|uniref:DNA topoisomerase 1 n=1 Tax=Mangrovibacterium diazotrophicum TaxID=1261403 RepID=A0A419W936_9BACT|nr:type I DNA topoisomerase [Mangrovibacterium diazotrophicum]RKD91959.1 DNA topoisomerase-1 [Mangrovibacterium diazotrophicum]